jgi:hypothetical protein
MKKIILGFGALAVVLGSVGFSTNTALAYKGDPSVKGPYYTTERHTAMEKAFENKDYEAWKNLMQNRGRVTEVINKDNFTKFAEAHELMEQGKTTEARKIMNDLGLGLGNGFKQGVDRGHMGRSFNR